MEVASEGIFDMVGLVSIDGLDVCMYDDLYVHCWGFPGGWREGSEL